MTAKEEFDLWFELTFDQDELDRWFELTFGEGYKKMKKN